MPMHPNGLTTGAAFCCIITSHIRALSFVALSHCVHCGTMIVHMMGCVKESGWQKGEKSVNGSGNQIPDGWKSMGT